MCAHQMNPRPSSHKLSHFLSEVLHAHQPCDVSLEAGFWMWNKVIIPLISTLSVLLRRHRRSPLWCRCQRADGGRLKHLWKRRHLFPLHRAEAGVICLTINIFMNTIKALTSSSVKFRVTRRKLIWSVSFLKKKTSKVKRSFKGLVHPANTNRFSQLELLSTKEITTWQCVVRILQTNMSTVPARSHCWIFQPCWQRGSRDGRKLWPVCQLVDRLFVPVKYLDKYGRNCIDFFSFCVCF